MPIQSKLLIFASGTKDAGGSGFENLVLATQKGKLDAEIMGVVSNHEHGGVRERADRLGVPFIYFPGPYESAEYQKIAVSAGADFVALSGWLKLVAGLNPKTTFNIHPAPLPEFGGAGLYGHKTHEAVLNAYRAGRIRHSAISMHFVTDRYDEGPVFFSHPFEIYHEDTPETLGERAKELEYAWQPIITNKVIHGEISWDGHNKNSLIGGIFQ
jgi:phosphoribosylglycinamide formyltransferase-1